MDAKTEQADLQAPRPAGKSTADDSCVPGQTAPVASAVVDTGLGARMGAGDTVPLRRRRPSLLHSMAAAFLPNRAVSPGTMRLIIGVQIAAALALWLYSPFAVLPRPDEVLRALQSLWMTEGLGPELWTSFKINLEALAWTAVLSLALSYLTVLPAFRPIVAAVSKGRFLSLVGFTFVFTLIVGGGHPLKSSLLVFGMTVFFVT